jgi:anti-sigma regulatory factor (Ser/Thr protein kinase)
LTAYDTWYCITFRYQGSDFNWARDRKPSVLAMDEWGYGMHIMKNAMHRVTYARNDPGLFQIMLSGILN